MNNPDEEMNSTSWSGEDEKRNDEKSGLYLN